MVTKADVQHLAKLSALHLHEDEIDMLAENLEKIVGYVGKLQEIETSPEDIVLQPVSGTVSELSERQITYEDAPGLLQNVQHPIVGQQIIIKHK